MPGTTRVTRVIKRQVQRGVLSAARISWTRRAFACACREQWTQAPRKHGRTI